MNRNSAVHSRNPYNLFGRLVAIAGVGSIILSIAFRTVTPVIVTGVGLFCILSFMNGLGVK